MRERSMERSRVALEDLQKRVAQGKLKSPEKIGAQAARILARHHGQRYLAWELKEGQFYFFPHRLNLKRELALEGKYLIQSEEPHLSPLQAVAAYKELSQVEQAFRHLKDLVELRPIYHYKEERVRAHIFVAALEALNTVRVVELNLGGEIKPYVTRGSRRAAEVLKALGIKRLDLPMSSAPKRTL